MAIEKPDDDLEELRAELRRLWAAATPGRWEAVILAGQGQNHLYAVTPKGSRWLLAFPNTAADARLMAAAKNALPRLFAEIDRRSAGLPVLGKVGDGGRITWHGAPPAASAAK